MGRPIYPFREAVVATMELLASRRPDLLPAYLEMVSHSPARFAFLELAADFEVREPGDLYVQALKAVADLDRLEKRRVGWRHPRQVVHEPRVGGLLHFCRARIDNVSPSDAAAIGRRRRLEIMAHKLERAWEREKTRAWIAAFIGTAGPTASGET